MEIGLRWLARSGSAEGFLDHNATKTVGNEDYGSAFLVWVSSKGLEGAEHVPSMVINRLLAHLALEPVPNLGVVSIS